MNTESSLLPPGRPAFDSFVPLPGAQRRLWFLDQLDPKTPSYNSPIAVCLAGDLRVETLRQCFARVVARHDALRMRVGVLDGVPVQQIAPGGEPEWHYLALDSLANRDAGDLRRLALDAARRWFDLESGPLLRVVLCRLAAKGWALIVSAHHIATDGTSNTLVMREVAELYQAFISGQPAQLTELGTCYVDHARAAEEQEQRASAEHSQYFVERLRDWPTILELAVDGVRAEWSDAPARVGTGKKVEVVLDERELAAVEKLCRRTQTTPFGVLFAAFAILLGRYSGQRKFTVGVPMSIRDQVELESLVGLFINVVPVAIDVTPGQTFEALLRQLRSELLDAHAHRQAPLEHLVQRLGTTREAGYTPLFQAICESAPPMFGGGGLPGLRSEPLPFDWDIARYDLTLSIRPEPGAYRLLLVYRSPLFEETTARAMMSSLLRTLRHALSSPQSKIELLGLDDASSTLSPSPRGSDDGTNPDANVWTEFARCVRSSPDRTALQCGERQLSFSALNARAEQIAAALSRRGVHARDRIAVQLGHDFDHWPVCLAVLRLGGICVPLDPRGAPARTAHIISDSGASLVVTRGSLDSPLDGSVPRLDLDGLPDLAPVPDSPSPGRTSGPHPAYILYTSGSSGAAKGVVVPHGALLHYAQSLAARLGFGTSDRFLSFIPTSLDPAIGNALAALLSGATLCVHPAPNDLVGEDVFRLCSTWGLTVLDMSVAFWHEWVAASPLRAPEHSDCTANTPLRLVMFGGESPSPEVFRRWCQLGRGRSPTIVTSYGPTECTVASSLATDADPGSMERLLRRRELGAPLGHARLYVADASMYRSAPGAPGELYVGGPNVALGYAGRPAETAARFVPDPFSGARGARLYRTGDGGRLRPDGALEFRGRSDRQVKINGHRVELGEIEAVLATHPAVKGAAAVLVQERGEPRWLAAYVEARATAHPTTEVLRDFLRERLPSHMVPSHFVEVASIPRTDGGKPLYRALPALKVAPPPGPALPLDATQSALAQLWCQVLGLASVGIDQSFFALGGHSLLAIRLVAEVRRKFECAASLRDLFERPTIREFSELLGTTVTSPREAEHSPQSDELQGERQAHEIVLDPAQRHRPFPLTEVQQAYWLGRSNLFALGNVGAQGYQEYRVGNVDARGLTDAVRRLIARHDMLRAVVDQEGTQRVLEHVPAFEVRLHDLGRCSATEAERQLEAIREEMSYRVFDPGTWPLFDVRLVTLAGGRAHICASFDILIGDEWSFLIILRELAALYRNPEAPLVPLELSFRDYVLAELRLQKTAAYRRAANYWRARLPAFPGPPELPLLKTLEECRVPRFVCRKSTLAPSAWTALQEHCRRTGVTPTALLLTVFSEVLARFSESEHFALMLTLFNRRPIHPQVEQIVGDFTALVAFETSVDQASNFAERVRHVQRRLWDDLDHSAFGGVQVLRELNRGAKRSQQAVLPIVFTSTLHQRASEADRSFSQLGDLFGQGVAGVSQTPQVLLDHGVREVDGSLVIYWNAVEEAFAPGVIDAMLELEFERLTRLVSDAPWLANAPNRSISVEVEPRVETPALAPGFDERKVAEPVGTLYDLFAAQCRKSPSAVAVVSEERSLSYAELESLAATIDAALRAAGIGPGAIVAVVIDKHWQQIAAILGVLRCGAVYLPLDPGMATARLRYCLESAGARAVLVRDALPALSGTPWQVIEVGSLAGKVEDVPPVATATDAMAYVIFTSGSTGEPKGVMIPHCAAINTVQDINRRFQVGANDRVLALSGIDFDLSVYDIFGLLATGGAVVVPSPRTMRDPQAWVELMRRERVTIWNTVPSLMSLLVDHLEGKSSAADWSLRLALLSGDWIPVSLPERVRTLAGGVSVVSLGGATEAAIWSIFHVIDRVDPAWSSIPYGKPLSGQSVYVYDHQLNVRPPWVTGEIYIGGAGVALGYLGDREKTERSFSIHPRTGERLYRTGDYGRYRPDGNIEFLGRRDQQVKIHGYRIELREVERALDTHPALAATAAAAVGDRRGEKTLVAYVVPKDDRTWSATDLRAYLRGLLPEYMVPVRFIPLSALPLTANGKVDRKALPDPAIERPTRAVSQALTPLERQVLAICARALGVPEVGPLDNFFALGGDSLIAIRLSLKLRETFQTDIPLRALFQAETLGELAQCVQRAAPASARPRVEDSASIDADPAGRHLPFPLTDIQEAFWVGRLGAFELGNVSTHVYWEFAFSSWVPSQANRALARLIQRHDMLRAVVLPDGKQKVLEVVAPYEAELLDLRQASEATTQSHLRESRAEMSHRVHQLDRWPLFEVRAHLLADGSARVHVGIDMIVADALSLMTLQRDFSRLYSDKQGADSPLTLTYRDCVVAQQKQRQTPAYQAAKSYWLERVARLPPAPELPYAHAPAALDAPRFMSWNGQLSPAAWARLRARGASVGLTSGVLLCAAFAEVIRRWSASPRFTLNLPLYNRPFDHSEVSAVVGPFTTNLLLAIEHEAGTSFESRARSIMRQLWDDLDHRHFGGVEVLREYARTNGDSRRALMPVVFNNVIVRDIIGADFKSEPMDATVVYASGQTSQVLLDCTVAEQQGALQFSFSAVDGAFAPGALEAMFGAYAQILEQLSVDESLWTERTSSLLTPPEPEPVLPSDPAPDPACPFVDELVLEALHAHPRQSAVVTVDQTLSYGELAQHSLAIAAWLRQRGVQRNQLVAVALEKGWEAIVAVLGILRAGAAFLPIDPNLPVLRIDKLLARCQVAFGFTHSRLRERLGRASTIEWLAVDAHCNAVQQAKLEPIDRSSADLAYVIFTSGSSGEPKGVMVEHRSLVSVLVDTNRRFGVGPADRLLSVSPLTFDMAVYDTLGVLAAGGTIVMPEAQRARDPKHWAELMSQEKITLWNSAPQLMTLLLEALEVEGVRGLTHLRYAFLGGDFIPLTMPGLLRHAAANATLVSVGGPTETTVWNIYYKVQTVDPSWTSIPYGRPFSGQKYYVLNDALQSCPVWVRGRLYCAGLGLARGYWQDAPMTAERFIVHPRTGERLYHTGDLGRLLPDGNIEILGREDTQLKINGYRVEPGEIEACLLRHGEVERAVVHGVNAAGGQKKLVAHLVLARAGAADDHDFRAYLRDILPDYMVPVRFLTAVAIPLTQNGKVDYRSLSAVAERSLAALPERPGKSPISSVLAAIFAEVIGVESIEPSQDLLALGASSVDIIRASNRLRRELGWAPDLRSLFEDSSLESLSKQYEAWSAALASSTQTRPRSERALIDDPEERKRFRERRVGIRCFGTEKHRVALEPRATHRWDTDRYFARRSRRRFATGAVRFESLCALLAQLSATTVDGAPRYLYGSPGGLYPVQVYLSIKSDRVRGLGAGSYYYHPGDHCLVSLHPLAEIDVSVHALENLGLAEQASFTLLFVADMQAIEPLYGGKSRDYALLQTGLMAQLLEENARATGLGVCQVGWLDFEKLRDSFDLGAGYEFLHAMVGGALDEAEAADFVRSKPDRDLCALRQQIDALAPEQLDQLLHALSPEDDPVRE